MIKIAFAGKMGCGKSTAAGFCDQVAIWACRTLTRVSFAKPLYDVLHFAQRRFGLDEQKDRYLLQMLGSWGRNQDKDLFVKLLIDSSKYYVFVVLDDLRYENEFNALKEDGWKCIKIIKPSESVHVLGTGDARHESELGLDGLDDAVWDEIIINDGTLEEFKKKVQKVVWNEEYHAGLV